MNFMIVSGIVHMVCSSFLISVCIFIVLKALLISIATMIGTRVYIFVGIWDGDYVS